MRLWGLSVAVLLSCYRAPQRNDTCTITCMGGSASCPGDLVCEGGFCVEPGQVCKPNFSQVTAGTGFACGIDANGSLWCWGANLHHQISQTDVIAYPLATRVDTSRNWQVIDAGGEHVCGIADGHLFCWGNNDRGQVSGPGVNVDAPLEIAIAGGPAAWTQVSTGLRGTCAIGDRKLWCWGANANGQLGDGTRIDRDTPTAVMSALDDWTAVTYGDTHTCAISATKGVYCWGAASAGQSGAGAAFPQPTPNQILDATAQPILATTVALSGEATCATTSTGQLVCWGSNADGELGEANVGALGGPTPVLASTSTGWTAVAATRHTFCGLRSGQAVCWGTTTNGGLGNGFWTQGTSDHVFAIVPGTMGAIQISLGWNEDFDAVVASDREDLTLACVVNATDTLCWGDDRYGQLSIGAPTMELTPTPIAGTHTFTDLQVGLSHGCGIENGAVLCWGSTEFGAATGVLAGNPQKACNPNLDCDVAEPKQLNFFSGIATDVALGAYHTCALHAPAITCWGDNRSGQLVGTTPTPPRERDIQGPGGAPWTAVLQTGRYGQCAVYRSGATDATACWGFVLAQRTGPTPIVALNGVRALALGSTPTDIDFECILDATGALQCEGDNTFGEYGNNSTIGVAALTAVSPARIYAALATNTYAPTLCAIRADGGVECWGLDDRGQTGEAGLGNTLAPNVLSSLAGCSAVAVGRQHACAICAGSIWCWGDNRFAQLGDGQVDAGPVTVPQHTSDPPPNSADRWVQLVAGSFFTCARSEQGLGRCWGFDLHAGLGNGGRTANLPVPVTATPAR